MQRSGDVIIAKITHNDGTGITLGYRALLKLLAAGNFISEARRTLLYNGNGRTYATAARQKKTLLPLGRLGRRRGKPHSSVRDAAHPIEQT